MNDIYLENEKKANRWAIIIMLIVLIAGVIVQILFFEGYTTVGQRTFHVIVDAIVVVCCIATVAIPSKLYHIKKYVIIISLMVDICIYCVFNPAVTFLLFFIPLLLSSRYYDKKLLYFTVIISFISMFVIWWGNAYFGFSLDLNLIRIEPNSVMSVKSDPDGWIDKSILEQLDNHERLINNILISLPEHLVFSLVYFAAVIGIGKSGMTIMEKREQLAMEKAAMERDLELASHIQLSMLTTNFESFGGENRADLYAVMNAAKEVGGDFYDFFMLGQEKLCIVIGDVSGKGIPASLFMVKTLTCIKNIAQAGLKPNEILQKVNRTLNKTNSELMFVTVWLGILDIKTGELEYCVGGHNPPLFMKNGGEYIYLEDNPNCAIAILPDIKYEMSSIQMEKGDRLFLYTDGVTECRDKDSNDFGEDRLKGFLNSNKSLNPREMVSSLENEIVKFTRECEQFDDITILCLKYQ